jgi:hypothetical protein
LAGCSDDHSLIKLIKTIIRTAPVLDPHLSKQSK